MKGKDNLYKGGNVSQWRRWETLYMGWIIHHSDHTPSCIM